MFGGANLILRNCPAILAELAELEIKIEKAQALLARQVGDQEREELLQEVFQNFLNRKSGELFRA